MNPASNQKPLGSHDKYLATAEAAGRSLIGSWLLHGPKQASFIDPGTMPTTGLVEVAGGVLHAMHSEGARDISDVLPHFHGADQVFIDELLECSQSPHAPNPESCGPLLKHILRFDTAKRRQLLLWELVAADERGDSTMELTRQLAEIDAGKNGKVENLSSRLEARVFNYSSHPPRPIPILQIAGKALCTPGNLLNIQALPKAGKSAVVESMIAAVVNGNRQGPDTLGFSAENPQGHAVVHFDTEQSRFDHDALVRRALRRARLETPPAWLVSYSVADMDIRDRRLALRHAMAEAKESHGGIFAVMIDGIADLCGDPNDSEEAFDLVHELHALAITHDCAIITVLHENPGSESGKTRGHLGSQLERKAECNLRLAKDADGITTIWAERARHCHLPKNEGPCFSWNDEAGMHSSCGTSGEIKSAAIRERMLDEAEKVFTSSSSFRHSDLMIAIGDALDLKERAAKLRVQKWTAEGIIRKDVAGNYHLSNP